MNTIISGKSCKCPYCNKKIAVEINHFLPEDKDKLETLEIIKNE